MKKKQQLILRLRPDCLDDPNRLDVAVIEAMMLWPDDELKRSYVLDAAYVELVRPHLADLPLEELASLVHVAADALPLSLLRAEAQGERCVRGLISGNVLHNVIAAIDGDSEPPTIGKIIEACVKSFCPEAHNKVIKERPGAIVIGNSIKLHYPKWRISKKTFETNIWPTFRPVAHFWAAWFVARKSEGDLAFPCNPANLPRFLADAEFYRTRGESTRTKQSPTAVLRPGEAVLLPEALGIEPSELHFHFPTP